MNRFYQTHGTKRAHRSEQGMVLIITLLVLVAMLLVSTALLRSSDTSIQVVNNVSFRQAAEAPANMAVEKAVQDILDSEFNGGSLPDYFYRSRQARESREGIPAVLLTEAKGSGTGFIQVADMGVSFVVERMCVDSNVEPTEAHCMLGGSVGGAVPVNTDGEYRISGGAGSPLYRVSVRVDGARNTRVFAQAFITGF